MTAQYLRRASLIIGSDSELLDLSALQFRFDVLRGDRQTPNTCSVRCYNLAKPTINKLKSGEFTALALRAGYKDNLGLIFAGTIKYVYFGHESAVDSYADIVAADGDSAYNYAVVNKSLSAGSTPQDHIALAAKSMKGFDVEFDTSSNTTINGGQLPRGKVFYGLARDTLRRSARDLGMTWSIQDGQLGLVLQTSYLPGIPVVLTAATGLVGFPEQTQNGINIRCLLNPAIKINGRVQIDNASVQQFHYDLSVTGQAMSSMVPTLDHDGMYKVLFAQHKGDTRGNDFYTDLTCIAVDQTAKQSEAILNKQMVGPVPPGPVNPYLGG